MRYLPLLLLLASCMKTDIINEVEPQLDTVMMQKLHRSLTPFLPSDTTSVDDTSRVGIGFNPTVEDWDEENNIDI